MYTADAEVVFCVSFVFVYGFSVLVVMVVVMVHYITDVC